MISSNRLYLILEKEDRRENLKKLLGELQKEFNDYADKEDFNAIVLLEAIKNLDL